MKVILIRILGILILLGLVGVPFYFPKYFGSWHFVLLMYKDLIVGILVLFTLLFLGVLGYGLATYKKPES